jgi:monoterpene epsilon-lactone hydrolase
MSREQAAAIARSLRDSPFDPGGDAVEQRVLFARLMATRPGPAGVVTSEFRLGGTPAIGISVGDPRADQPAVLYFHGGGYAVGTAAQTIGLPAEIARRGNCMVLSVDYRLAPEDPFPAAVDDGLDAYEGALGSYSVARLAVAGESAGGGLALATLLAARQRGLPMPAAVLVMSPWVDLTLSGPSLTTKASVDPVMTLQALERRAEEYAGNEPRTNPLVSPLLGDFGGFPPLLIQVGSHEILLDDAVRLAGRAGASDVTTVLRRSRRSSMKATPPCGAPRHSCPSTFQAPDARSITLMTRALADTPWPCGIPTVRQSHNHLYAERAVVRPAT